MTPMRFRTMRLSGEHDRTDFCCGDAALDAYLKKQAGQDGKRGVSNTIVATALDSNVVMGFYTLSAYAVDLTMLPVNITRKLPRYGKIPAILLGRLAVDNKAQGQKLGGFLLHDALARALSGEVGWVVFLVHAKNDKAVDFYRHFGFHSFEHEPMTLYIHRKTAEGLFAKPS